MVFANAFVDDFGQTDTANLDKADNNQIKNAKAKVFVADIVDRNNKNRNKHRNDAQKRRKERKE
jgi:hypothetical protein